MELWIFPVWSSVQFSHSVMSDSLWTYGLQLARLPCPSPTLGAGMSIESVMPSNHLILCHPLLLRPLSFPASGSFPVSQFFTSGSQSIGVSALASVLPMNIQDWFPLGWTGLTYLQFKGLSRVFFNTTVQKHQFFGSASFIVQLSCPYITIGKNMVLTRWTFVSKLMSLLLNWD